MFRFLVMVPTLHSFVMVLATKNDETEMMKPYMLPIPPNNHGIQPKVLINEEVKPSKNNLLTVIPVLSTEWSVTFNVRIMTIGSAKRNLIRFSKNPEELRGYGTRIPLVRLKTDKTIKFCSEVNANWEYCNEHGPFNLNQTYHMEVHQRYISNGEYKYYVIVDGVEVQSVVNTDAKQFNNVHVYASDDISEAADAYISNFYHVNFL